MIDKDKADRLIQGWALGCLDDEEFEEMQKFLESDQDIFREQIGDYQNLAALLPLALEPVKPGVQAKDKLARKLYRIKEELLAKKAKAERLKKEALERELELKRKAEQLKKEEELKNKPEQITAENPAEKQQPDSQTRSKIPSVEELVHKNDSKEKVTEFEVVSSKRFQHALKRESDKITDEPVNETGKSLLPETESLNLLEVEKKYENRSDEPPVKKEKTEKKYKEKEKPYRETSIFTPPPIQKQSKFPVIFMIGLTAILLMVILFAYFSVKNSFEEVQTQAILSNEKLDNLSSRLQADLNIDQFLTGDFLGIVNLSGTNLYPSGNGKLLINFDSGESILLLNDLPPAADQRDYQLWINAGGEYYSLKVFNMYPGSKYFTFSLPPLSGQFETKFIVTEEISGGAESPGRRIFLEGIYR